MNSLQKTIPLAVILLFSILSLSCSPDKWAAFLKEFSDGSNVPKLNRSIIFDLYMNYELTENNGNLNVLLNYIPLIDGELVSTIVMEGETAGKPEFISFEYSYTGNLTDILYQTDSDGIRRTSRNQYKVFYTGDIPNRIEINGEPKIQFGYNNEGRIERINRLWDDGITYEYIFSYRMSESIADITLHVIENDVVIESIDTYFVNWNGDLKLDGFELDRYSSELYNYTIDGLLKSMNYNLPNSSSNNLIWSYTLDDRNNWISRRAKDTYAEREITYRN